MLTMKKSFASLHWKKIDQLIMRDSRKSKTIDTTCKVCGLLGIDNNPKWHRKTGKYIAKQTTVACKAALVGFKFQ